jgi:hypothetical protein
LAGSSFQFLVVDHRYTNPRAKALDRVETVPVAPNPPPKPKTKKPRDIVPQGLTGGREKAVVKPSVRTAKIQPQIGVISVRAVVGQADVFVAVRCVDGLHRATLFCGGGDVGE